VDPGHLVPDLRRDRRSLDEALKPELYFAYGSNLDEQQMRERCPGSRPLFRATLPGHRLDFTHYSAARWKGGTADIVPDRSATVWGLVYEMGSGDFAKLDRWEGGYARVTLRVLDDAGEPHEVTSYSVRDKGSFPPHAIYLGKILREADRLGFPRAYLEALRGRYPV
jgi:gamma-glutamylcyclotransferase (GGCT)/AIG2-like uncharacterized protein YtfP